MICDVSFFLEQWNQLVERRQRVEHILQPTRQAILSTFKFPTNVLWDNNSMELVQKNDRKYELLLSGSYYSHGEMENISWQIPLEACLEGRDAVLAFFKSEEEARMRVAREAGERREMHERDERYRRFLLLKQEFEPKTGVELVKA